MAAISGATLLARLKREIGKSTNNPPSSIRVDDELSRYFTVPQGVIAFAKRLKSKSEFTVDGLNLRANDVRDLTDVAGLHEAVKTWYRAHGWTVT
jgi:hypothetical protein